MKQLVILLIFSLQILYANNYAADASGMSLQKAYQFFGDKERADAYFHKYYRLTSAISSGKLDVVKTLVEEIGADAKVPYESFFKSPLMYALGSAKYEIAKYLLEHEADPNCHMDVYNSRTTALMFVASKDNPKYLDLLLEYGADANIEDGDGYTSLDLALGMVSAANEDIIRMLIPITNLNKPIKRYTLTDKLALATPLTIAFKYHRNSAIINMLLDAGANAGKSADAKFEFLKVLMSDGLRYQEDNLFLHYGDIALGMVENCSSRKVINAKLYLLVTMKEFSVIHSTSLSKNSKEAFEKMAKRDPKAKAFLVMFQIIEDSKKTDVQRRLKIWENVYAKYIKNWDFSDISKWSDALSKERYRNVTKTVSDILIAVNRNKLY